MELNYYGLTLLHLLIMGEVEPFRSEAERSFRADLWKAQIWSDTQLLHLEKLMHKLRPSPLTHTSKLSPK